ncbi:MAG: hypothetical protein AMK73_01700 [Planctomycetes bacterium SM23_32]|nr:MAG: hypothetical protein AMK73_01700 [Planctomycetes bacterium SM23_32]
MITIGVAAALLLVLVTWGLRWRRASQTRRDWHNCLLLVTILGLVYAALHNGRLVPGGGDDLFYLSVARNLARSGRYIWNGSPVTKVPPAWPLAISWLMRLSTLFAVLDLLPMLLCLLAAAIWYWVLRNFASPARSFTVALIGATLFHWHRSSCHFYSEAMFSPLLAGALLVALRIRDGKGGARRILLLVLLCASMVMVRYAAVLFWPVIAGALVSKQLRLPWDRRVLAAALTSLAFAGTFFGVWTALQTNARKELARLQAQLAELPEGSAGSAALQACASATDTDLAKRSRKLKRLTSPQIATRLRQTLASGRWLARLLWPPTQLDRRWGALALVANTAGWALIALFLFAGLEAARNGEWIWMGEALHCAAFAALWSVPNGRYLAPTAPLLLLGIWRGAEEVSRLPWLARYSRHVCAANRVLLASVLLCNGLIWAFSAAVVHSERFQTLCMAGEYGELVAVAEFLTSNSLADGGLAIAPATSSGQRRYAWHRLASRTANLLTDRIVVTCPPGLAECPPNDELVRWAGKCAVRFYLGRAPSAPARQWHIRLPSSEERTSGPGSVPAFFELYEFSEGEVHKVRLPSKAGEVTRVPGLD